MLDRFYHIIFHEGLLLAEIKRWKRFSGNVAIKRQLFFRVASITNREKGGQLAKNMDSLLVDFGIS